MKYTLIFENNLQHLGHDEALIEINDSIKSKKELIELYKSRLHFPYKGETNWDGFYDILSDLYWTDINKTIVFHSSFPQLRDDDLKTYLETIFDLINSGEEGGKSLKFVFKKEDQEKVMNYLSSYKT